MLVPPMTKFIIVLKEAQSMQPLLKRGELQLRRGKKWKAGRTSPLFNTDYFTARWSFLLLWMYNQPIMPVCKAEDMLVTYYSSPSFSSCSFRLFQQSICILLAGGKQCSQSLILAQNVLLETLSIEGGVQAAVSKSLWAPSSWTVCVVKGWG